MKFARLIALAAGRELQRDPGLLGVRLSPVSLRPDSVRDVVGEAVRVLGKRTFIAVSVPGVTYELEGRLCIAPDARAAERATAWRNTVRVAEGERILYVSVEPHGKAGGLQDCLFPLDERALRTTLIEWAREDSSGLPEGLAGALVDAGITERVSAAALCSFTAGVLKDGKKLGPWEAAGQNLPTLGFAADTRLRRADAVQRLRINADLVMKAAAGERRHKGLAVRSELVAGLVDALHQGLGDDLPNRLAAVDLGGMTTTALERVRKPLKKQKALAAPKGQGRLKKTARKSERRARPKADSRADHESVLDGALGLPVEQREAALMKSAGALLGPSGPPVSVSATDITAPPTTVTGSDGASDVWSFAMHRREFGEFGQLPPGLAEVLTELAQRGGWQLLWEPQRDARSCLTRLPSTLELAVQRFDVPEQIRDAFNRWREARGALLDRLMREGHAAPLLLFAAAPLSALGDPEVRARVTDLDAASRVLYGAAGKAPGSETPLNVLCLDTALFRTKAGDAVIVLGPFHPLWLSQCLSRFEAMLNEPRLEKEGRRLLVRSLTEAPAAPQTWPISTDGKELTLARPEAGFITYESEPSCADDATLAFVGEQLISRYLDLLPHARLGLRVAVEGEGAFAFIEGVASAASRTPDLERVEILYSGSSLNLDGRFASEQIAAGRLVLSAMPSAGSHVPGFHGPHLAVRMVPPPTRPEDEEPGVPEVQVTGAGSGLLPTEFQVTRTGLRARIPLDGHAMLEAIEALHAFSRGRLPQRSFVGDATVTPLAAVFPSVVDRGTWQVAIGRRLGRRPAPGLLLLAHERVTDSAHLAAVSDNINPISRALEGGFRRLGVNDLRPSILRVLATRLAEACSTGLVSMGGADDHLIASGLLGLFLRAECGRDRTCVLAPVERASALALLGRPLTGETDGATMVAIAPQGRLLKAFVGFATLSPTGDANVARGQLEGGLADRLSRLLAVLNLAKDSRSLGGMAAREALNWLIWPAIAAAEIEPGEFTRQVEGIGQGTDVAIEVVCLAPPANSLGRRGEVRLGRVPVRTVPLDVPLVERLVLAG